MAGRGRSPRPRKASEAPQAFLAASAKARETREAIAALVAGQLQQQIADGTVMGGRAEVAARVQRIVEAERRGDVDALRAAALDLATAAGAWVVAMDFRPPMLVQPRNSRTEVAI